MNGLVKQAEGGLARRPIGLLLAAGAAICASSAGLLLRSVEAADVWTILVYRSIGYVLFMVAMIALMHRSRFVAAFRSIGSAGLVVTMSLGVAFVTFLLAMSLTTVATVVALLSASPFFAALAALAVLGERPGCLGWIAMVLAAVGVAAIVAGELDTAPGWGLLMGVVACAGYSVTIVALRAGNDRDMTPALCLAGAVGGVLAFFLADDLAASQRDVAIGLALGAGQIGLQYLLIGFAARYALASDIALVMILEVILAPLWVWLVFGETAPGGVLLSGVFVIAALGLNALSLRRGP